MTIKGTSGDDNLTGTSGHDVFVMVQGGSDTVDGGDGNDCFRFGDTFATTDSIAGGAGTDKLLLNGDYSATLYINSTMLSGVEQIAVGAGHDYALAFFDGVIANGQSLTVNATHLGAADSLTVDGGNMTVASVNTTLIVNGGAGDISFTGGAGDNILRGGKGQDLVYFGDNFDSHDHLNGGGGDNILQLTGDYSAGLHLTTAMMQNFQTMQLQGGYSYALIMNDGNVAAGQTLVVESLNLGVGDSLNFNGSRETDGNFNVTDGAGDDVISGGAQNDLIYGIDGGVDKFYGNGGDDHLVVYDHLTAADRMDGGDGNDEVDLSGDYSAGLTFDAATLKNVEVLYLGPNNNYNLIMNDGNVAAGQHMDIVSVDDGRHTVAVDASAESDGTLFIGGGDGEDILIGGQAGNTLYGNLGQDHMTAGAASDVFLYVANGESLGAYRDVITGFDAKGDSFNLPGTVSAVDAAVGTGTLNEGNFDTDLAAAVDFKHMAPGDAVLFTADSGDLAGHTFLIVDTNGVAGYQAGDMVVELVSATNLASLAAGSFT